MTRIKTSQKVSDKSKKESKYNFSRLNWKRW